MERWTKEENVVVKEENTARRRVIRGGRGRKTCS